MATSQGSDATQERNKPITDDHHELLQDMGWKCLFSFTTQAHVPILCTALFFAFIAALTLPAMAVLFGLIFRQFTDFASGKISSSDMLQNSSNYCIYLTAVCAGTWFTNSVYFMLFLAFSELQARSARERIFNGLLHKNMEWYDSQESGIAALLPTIQTQIRDLQISTSIPLGEGVQTFVAGLASLGVALYFSWDLTLITICTVPVVYLIMNYLSGRLSKRAHEQADKLQQALKYFANAIQYIETVKCFNGERFELMRYARSIAAAGGLYKRQASLRSSQLGFMQFYMLSIFFQGFWYGSYLVTSGKQNPGDVITTFWGALMAVENITSFLPQLIVLQKGKIAGSRLREVMETISKDDNGLDTGGGCRPTHCSGDIEFKKVSFAYPSRPKEPALINGSIFFPAGETTFVVGRSGSGKSTLGQLLVRFYKPGDGQITIDGNPLDKYDVRWLRENITLVEQQSVLFDDAIRYNIALAKNGGIVSDKTVDEVVKFALLEETIKDLPKGLETLVGMKGSSLSGGQRQRVAIARARLRDTPILILDESTSALDYATRAAIIEAIRTWRRGKTTIIITHDITQIQPNDFLYIMDKAEVVQEGYRKDLDAEISTAFHTFLDVVPEEDHYNGESGSDDDTDEILSLYADSWTARPRTATEMLLEQTIVSAPFFSPSRNSGAFHYSMMVERTSPLSNIEHNIGRGSQRPQKPLPLPASASESLGMEYLKPTSASDMYPRPMSTANPISTTESSRFSRLSEDVPIRLDLHAPPPPRNRFRLRRTKNWRSKRPTSDEITVPHITIFEILKTVWPNLDSWSRLLLIAAVSCALVHAAATPVFGFIFARLLSTFYISSNKSHLALIYSLTILGIAIIDGVATYGFQFLFDSCAQTWANNLKMEAVRRILIQPREFFDKEENSLSRLAETLDNFGEEARNLPGRFVGIAIVVVAMLAIAIVWSLFTCWKLALVALGTGPLLYAIVSSYNAISSRWETLSNEADENVGQVLHETFVNIRTVRCLVLEDVFKKKFVATTTAALKTGLKRAIYTGSLFGLNFAGVLFVSTLCFWFGAYIISTKEFSTTSVLQVFTILLTSANHINFIINYIPQINIARDAGSRLLRLARLPQDSHEQLGRARIAYAGDIEFNNLTFSYPGRKDHTVLNSVSFTIPRGGCTAIVGPSGSGKSTIASLLLKLYETSSTHAPDLKVSHRNIKSLHTATLREHLAVVSQTPIIFPGTVAENITYGLSPSSSRVVMDNVRAAAHAAGIDDFIMSLPEGYSTVVGEGGTGLSGGQAQRIAIARTLVRNPDILILDEATSSLDVESARIIRDTVQRLLKEKNGNCRQRVENMSSMRVENPGVDKAMTVVIITHAKEMMAVADNVIMLDKGRVIEEGSFDDLKRVEGPFKRLLRGELGKGS